MKNDKPTHFMRLKKTKWKSGQAYYVYHCIVLRNDADQTFIDIISIKNNSLDINSEVDLITIYKICQIEQDLLLLGNRKIGQYLV